MSKMNDGDGPAGNRSAASAQTGSGQISFMSEGQQHLDDNIVMPSSNNIDSIEDELVPTESNDASTNSSDNVAATSGDASAGVPSSAHVESNVDPTTENDGNEIHDGSNTDNRVGSGGGQLWRKQKRTSGDVDIEIGAVQVNEQAPQLHRRFYLGLDRASARLRQGRRRRERAARRRGQEAAAAANGDNTDIQQTSRNDGEGNSHQPRRSSSAGEHNTSSRRASMRERFSGLIAHVSAPNVMVHATLVESGVVQARPVRFCERKWKVWALLLMFFVVMLATLLSIMLVDNAREDDVEVILTVQPSIQPSTQPSIQPSQFRPTLQVVQERGLVRCGLWIETIENGGYQLDLCRAVAAVILGHPDKIEKVPVTVFHRFTQLQERNIDVLLFGDTHTLERDLKQKVTGAGFTFSSPYLYDGMSYYGEKTYVECAENQTRFGVCSSLRICVAIFSTPYLAVKPVFPPVFIVEVNTVDEQVENLISGVCNVMASDRSIILGLAFRGFIPGGHKLGDKVHAKEPLAIVTRKNDREFSDVINWVVHALYYGEEQGLAKDVSLCQTDKNLTSRASDLNFLNACYCVGNYAEVVFSGISQGRGMNQINNGTSGMLYTIPFGLVGLGSAGEIAAATTLSKIVNEGSLNCGVVVPSGFNGDITASNDLVGMSVEYCHTLAAALFNGEYTAVNLFAFSETDNQRAHALLNETIDVLAGERIQREYDFARSLTEPGLYFSTPYFYGNETAVDNVSFYSIATREDDGMFSSFVNAVVMSPIHAEEKGIERSENLRMPIVVAFGEDLRWALRDAIAYSGSYDQMYAKNFGQVPEKDRGRNTLNNKGGPQIHSFPSFK